MRLPASSGVTLPLKLRARPGRVGAAGRPPKPAVKALGKSPSGSVTTLVVVYRKSVSPAVSLAVSNVSVRTMLVSGGAFVVRYQ